MKTMLHSILVLSGLTLGTLGAHAQTPSKPERLAASGWEHYRHGRLEAAVQDFNRAVRLAPDNRSAAEGLAQAAYELQDWTNAKRGYEIACALSPENCDFTKRLASVYLVMKLYDRALLQFEQVVGESGSPGCDPADFGAKTNLGYLYSRSQDEKSDAKAFEILNQVTSSAAADSSSLSQAHFHLGNLYKRKGDLDLAIQNLERCFELAPGRLEGRDVLEQLLLEKKALRKGG